MPPRSSSRKSSASAKAISKKMERKNPLFYKYANRSSGKIEPDGVVSLCKDLGIDHTNIKILLFAWKMESEKQGYFTLEEWQRGIQALGFDTITNLKKALQALHLAMIRAPDFVDFYSYAFRYCLTEEKQKTVDIESICQLLELVLGFPYRYQVAYFVEFLKGQTEYKVLNMDQWMGFYRFVTEITFPDFSNYDSELAWPSILDDFVNWMKAK